MFDTFHKVPRGGRLGMKSGLGKDAVVTCNAVFSVAVRRDVKLNVLWKFSCVVLTVNYSSWFMVQW